MLISKTEKNGHHMSALEQPKKKKRFTIWLRSNGVSFHNITSYFCLMTSNYFFTVKIAVTCNCNGAVTVKNGQRIKRRELRLTVTKLLPLHHKSNVFTSACCHPACFSDRVFFAFIEFAIMWRRLLFTSLPLFSGCRWQFGAKYRKLQGTGADNDFLLKSQIFATFMGRFL